MMRKTIIIGVVIYLVTSVVAYLLFSAVFPGGGAIISTPVPEPKVGEDGVALFDESLPKTEECPLTGTKYSKQQKAWWEKHRPLGIMIEDHQEARPQSGLLNSDIVYEAVAEGGITRFLAVYYCQDAPIVGPVRSARTYFLDFVSEYGDFPLYAHVGGANTSGPADALGQIEDYGWAQYNDLNQFSIGFPTFWRDYDRLGRTVATEHTMYSSTSKLWSFADKKRKLSNKNEDGDSWDKDFTAYTFKEDVKLADRSASQVINFEFWEGYGAYSVKWSYDKATNTYLRENGGEVHTDFNNKKQLNAKNVVVLYMKESRANDGYEGNLHMIYGTKGTGKAKIFMDGQEVSATWSKKTRTSHLVLSDSKGKELALNPGRIWFEVLSPNSSVEVE